MSRLTSKLMGQVVLPIIPMEIKSKEDLYKYHEVRREYEAMAIKIAEYEDKEEQGLKGITLKNIDLTGITNKEQYEKVKEERTELLEAIVTANIHMPKGKEKATKEQINHVIEEFWDTVQSQLGWLHINGITAEEVMKEYPKHLEKIKHRPRIKEDR